MNIPDFSTLRPDAALADVSEWPVAHIRFPELDEPDRVGRVLGALDALLAQRQPFAVIWSMASHDHDDEPHEDEKRATIWIRQRKGDLRAFCKGYVYVAPTQELHDLLAGRFRTVQKLYGFPLLLADDREDARRQAQALLAA